MTERFVESFVDKLILLEQKAGASVHYRVMPPLSTIFHDHLSIQKTAKNIAKFVGLAGYTFIIAEAKQKERVGGHIDLSTEGSSVFIEIDSEMINFPDAVAATLCHEICHKWLEHNGIRSALEIDDEILTDITSVFLGFGKIMLNGCKSENVRHESIPNGTRTITETMKAGYLDREQLAFVYCMVCAMRRIPLSDAMKDLNAEATRAVRACNSSYGQHYTSHFHEEEAAGESVEGFKSLTIQTQYIMAELDKHVTYASKSFCDTVNDFLKNGHRKLESSRQKAVELLGETSADLAMRFLVAIKTKCEIDRLSEQVQAVSQETEAFLEHARQIGLLLSKDDRRFPAPAPAMFNIVICPQDGTKLRMPENSGNRIAICPVCKYRFAYNTNAITFSEKQVALSHSWWQRLFKRMGSKAGG